MQKLEHLVFYDGECGLCDRTVQLLLTWDQKQLFAFAPLQGETAKEKLKNLPAEFKNIDSLILIENFKTPQAHTYVMSKAVFRILWLIGGGWALIGWLNFLPSFLWDWAYRLVARYRHQLFPSDSCTLPTPDQKERFLP